MSLAKAPSRSLGTRVFAAWSIDVPPTFNEAAVEGAGWHGYDADRSISLTSVALTEEDEPVIAERIVDQLAPAMRLPGRPVADLPPGLEGWAAIDEATQPARASKTLSGVLAADGRILIVTITADDLEWARRTWLSIRHHPAPLPPTATRPREAARLH
ncbi:MAG TPA: hypothetical protein VFS32_08490 [Candidatus Limnocylindrales bacterium]|nr:hypothetical protein [Candidatus Limnocylindrales bacterium]